MKRKRAFNLNLVSELVPLLLGPEALAVLRQVIAARLSFAVDADSVDLRQGGAG